MVNQFHVPQIPHISSCGHSKRKILKISAIITAIISMQLIFTLALYVQMSCLQVAVCYLYCIVLNIQKAREHSACLTIALIAALPVLQGHSQCFLYKQVNEK